jgi:signal transduction histidine kinase/CheY-like chemotaxis protein
MSISLLTVEVCFEQDVVLTRQQTRQVAELLGFETQDQVRLATAVSEIARNAFQYAGRGTVEFGIAGETPDSFVITVRDRGRGIADLPAILEGRYTSTTGMGLGIIGTKRLMDQFEIQTAPGQGTVVQMGKRLPKKAPHLTPQRWHHIVSVLAQRSPQSPFEELQRQNQELLQAMAELRQREEELMQLNRELEDTNRGVVALYAELDEKAESLQRANELKTRFLSNMSHEFRTPLNSIVSLSRILLDRLDGALTPEQEKQVMLIRKSAEGLTDLVNDLLDLAKVEAGKIVVHPTEFDVGDLFATLRGMLRPLLTHPATVALVFEKPVNMPMLYTDEGKVAQILRNFISNALKFTQQGEVRVTATRSNDGGVIFAVSDTGIGIAPDDQTRIFEDFVQIDSDLQKQLKGTGLGLPLSRKLAELLGGQVAMTSRLGQGSTFSATIPMVYPGTTWTVTIPALQWQLDPQRSPILVLDHSPETLMVYEKYLERSRYQLIPALTLTAAKQALEKLQPTAVILDGESQETTGTVLMELQQEMKSHVALSQVPILVTTAKEHRQQAIEQGANDCLIQPYDRLSLLNKLNSVIHQGKQQTLLLIDDDLASRYVVRQWLANPALNILEADNGRIGLQIAQTQHPQAIVLDLTMPELSGIEVLDQLKRDPVTADIPVVIYTAKLLTLEEQADLTQRTLAVLAKTSSAEGSAIDQLREALLKAGLVLDVDEESHA